jgi:hypothetical protein
MLMFTLNRWGSILVSSSLASALVLARSGVPAFRRPVESFLAGAGLAGGFTF